MSTLNPGVSMGILWLRLVLHLACCVFSQSVVFVPVGLVGVSSTPWGRCVFETSVFSFVKWG